MRIGVIGYRGEYGFERLLKASERFGEAVPVHPDSLRFDSSHGLEIPDVNLLLVRDLGGESLEERAFRMDMLFLLSEHLPVFNPPEAINTAGNKFLTYFRFLKEGIPFPRTILGREILLHFDAVKKPVFGYQGIGVELRMRGEFIKDFSMVQEFIRGEEYRVFVIGDEIFGAVRKVPREGEWRANISLGARAESAELDEEILELSIRASSSVGCIFSAVDLILGSEPHFLEVNATPNFRSFPGAEERIVEKCIELI
ncbi:MAG: ATP-grasp domain-containing protein [Archaeoglobi archaeon]|nr:ATP-grasp domain-containing protein [Candidatus Mnemosynella bozhongmuii]